MDRDITLDAPEETRLYVEFEDRATVGADNDGMIFPYRLETEIVVDAAVAESNLSAQLVSEIALGVAIFEIVCIKRHSQRVKNRREAGGRGHRFRQQPIR